jgi:two-component system LytT family response regulator
MKTLKAILIDDERLARSSLRALLAEHPQIEIVAEGANVRQARDLIETHRPDVVFLDIQMPGGSGFDLLEQLQDPPPIVFVTAFDEYAIRAFEVNALDYLLKPVEPQRLARAIARLQRPESAEREPVGPYAADDRVLVKTSRQCFFLSVAEIAAVQAADNYSYVVCAGGEKYLVRRSLKQWEGLLPADCFASLDRSWLVNWRQVSKWNIGAHQIELCVGRLSKPLVLGRAAAHRFKTEILPRIQRGETEGAGFR